MSAFMDAVVVDACRAALQVGLGVLLQSTLLIALGLLAAALLRWRGPALRSIVYKATLASVMLGPVLSFYLAKTVTPLWRVSLPAVADASAGPGVGEWERGSEGTIARLGRVFPTPVTSSLSPDLPISPSPPLPHRPVALYVAAVGMWGVGALGLLAWLGLCQASVLRLRARSRPIVEGAAAEALEELAAALRVERPLLLAGDGVRSPFLTGLWRPAILLPASYATDFDAEALRAILAHELSHLARRDLGWNLLGRIGCALAWPQPLLWVLCRRMEQVSEELCDQVVIQRHCAPRDYAHCLLDLAERSLLGRPERVVGAGVVPGRSSLARRVQQILAGPRAHSLSLSRRLRATVALGAGAAVIAGVFLVAATGESTATERVHTALGLASKASQTVMRFARAVAPPITAAGGGKDGAAPPGRSSGTVGMPFWGDLFLFSTTGELTPPEGSRTPPGPAPKTAGTHGSPTREKVLLTAAPGGEPAAAGPGALSGTVQTPDGKPVAGAEVYWVSRADRETRSRAVVRSDAAGRFRFEDAARLRDQGEPPRLLLVLAEGWGATYREIRSNENAITLTLAAATTLRVPFVGPAGRPVSGLQVGTRLLTTVEFRFCYLPEDLAERFAARTDGSGVAVISGLPRGYQVDLTVNDARYGHLSSEDRIRLSASPVTQAGPIRLVPGASLRGRVTHAATGKPAAGIRVAAQGLGRESGWGEALTDPDGVYDLRQLRAGSYNVALDLKDEIARSWTARAHERLTVTAGESRDGIDFALIPGVVITGKVTAEDNGEPIAGIPIGVYGPAHPQSGAWVQRAVTGPDGVYVHRVPPGAQYLYLQQSSPPPGFLLPVKKHQELTARDGETVTIDFRLPRGKPARPVHGRVLGPDGQPVAGADVVLVSSGRIFVWPTTRQADAGGAFTLEETLVVQPVMLRARHAGMGTLRGTTATAGDDVTLRLQKDVMTTLSGTVIDGAGKPIAGAEVWLAEWTYDSGASREKLVTDARGRYAFTGLWPDARYSIRAMAEKRGEKSTRTLELRPGEQRTAEPLVLLQADRSVAGRVVDDQGKPVAGITVWVNGRETRQQGTTTDGEGRFQFTGVVDEDVELQAHADRDHWTRWRVPAGEREAVLALPETGKARAFQDDILRERLVALQGREAPALHAVAWVNAAPRTLAQLRGKMVLIDFWAIGCGPCVAALPAVQRTAEQFAAKGVVVIGLHASGTEAGELRAFAKQQRLTYPLAIDAEDAQRPSFGQTFRQYAVDGIPAYAVIDRAGKCVYLGGSLADAVARLGD